MITINSKKECMGCYACSNICPKKCISMERDNEGFSYPNVNFDICIKCGKCIKVCPIINKTIISNEPIAYACINKDETIRMKSSSGGIFTLVAEQILDNGGVVFGACFDEDFGVEHSYIETKDELHKFRGSKYVQSEIGCIYSQVKDFLKQKRKVLFTGTPCQIEGLKSYLGQVYENLLCIDIVCHGVPSPIVWQKYISHREECSGSQVRKIDFRQKSEGWKRYSVSFLFNDNTEYLQTFDNDLYMKAFLRDICLRPSCYSCEFKTLNRQSDITLADFWGIEFIIPEMDDDKGTSLIFVNSSKGQAILEKISDKIIYKEVDIHQAVTYNPAVIKSANYNRKRYNFFKDLDKLPFDSLVIKYCIDDIFLRVKRKGKFFIYTIMKKAGLSNIVKNIRLQRDSKK